MTRFLCGLFAVIALDGRKKLEIAGPLRSARGDNVSNVLTFTANLRNIHSNISDAKDFRSMGPASPASVDATKAASLRIPKKLFLTSHYVKMEHMPHPEVDNVQRMMDLNHDLTVVYFDDDGCRKYLEEKDRNDLVALFEEYRDRDRGKLASDVCRAAYLYYEGGFYLDNDVELLKPLTEMVTSKTTFMSVWEATHEMRAGVNCRGVLNAVMGTVPRSKILELTLATMLKKKSDYLIGSRLAKLPPVPPPSRDAPHVRQHDQLHLPKMPKRLFPGKHGAFWGNSVFLQKEEKEESTRVDAASQSAESDCEDLHPEKYHRVPVPTGAVLPWSPNPDLDKRMPTFHDLQMQIMKEKGSAWKRSRFLSYCSDPSRMGPQTLFEGLAQFLEKCNSEVENAMFFSNLSACGEDFRMYYEMDMLENRPELDSNATLKDDIARMLSKRTGNLKTYAILDLDLNATRRRNATLIGWPRCSGCNFHKFSRIRGSKKIEHHGGMNIHMNTEDIDQDSGVPRWFGRFD